MYNTDEFKNLCSKYGGCSSWAIWDYKNPKDTQIINKYFNQLNSNFVLLGLNISRPLVGDRWQNFHHNTHDRKIKYACNDTILRGSYITDLFKNIPEANAGNLEDKLTDELINKNVKYFISEMKDIKLNDKTQFIVFGTPNSLIVKYFDKYFRPYFTNNVIFYYHYSYYTLTDKQWVCGFWNLLNINQAYDSIIKKFKQ